jgi:phosphatidate cytidylyltransferase
MIDFLRANMNLVIAIGGVFLLLIIATVSCAILKKRKPENDYNELGLRIRTWWIIVVIFAVSLLSCIEMFLVFMVFASFLAMKEYFSLIPTRRVDRRVLLWAYLAIPIQYWWIYDDWFGMFIIFVPVYMFLLIGLRLVLVGQTEGFLRSAGTIHWGLMMTVFSLSHIACLYLIPLDEGTGISWKTLVFYLMFLTQINDVAQYIWGKSFGKFKVIPHISPNKTVAGLVGGVVSTIILAVVLGPFFTPLNFYQSMFAGLIIGLGGFFGDVTISALKRDLKIKDSGAFLPGHGGILDRLDSLTFTAPLFLHFLRYIYT